MTQFSNLNRLLLVVSFSLFVSHAFTQTIEEQYKAFDDLYGYDNQIYMGAKYLSEHSPQYGHPFLYQKEPYIGTVKSTKYKLDSVNLWFDVYNQFLVYGYINHIGSKQQIILNQSDINEFTLGQMVFISNPFESISSSYVQRITTDSISCYLAYRKVYKYTSNNSKKGFGYTDETRKVYLAFDNKVSHISNTSSLLKSLPQNIQGEVKRFVSDQSLKISKATDVELLLLFEFINSQLK